MKARVDWGPIREELHRRSRGRCEGCGRDRGELGAVHHRKLRSQGGGHGLENLMVLHPACHVFAHGHPKWSKTHGWIVPASLDPAEVVVQVCPLDQLCLHGR